MKLLIMIVALGTSLYADALSQALQINGVNASY